MNIIVFGVCGTRVAFTARESSFESSKGYGVSAFFFRARESSSESSKGCGVFPFFVAPACK